MEKGFYILMVVCVFLIGCFVGTLNRQRVTIDLPEEYSQINDSTEIKGRFNKDTNTLTIEFNN